MKERAGERRAGNEPADTVRAGGEPFVGPRDWPPAEMRWPPYSAPEPESRGRRRLPWGALLALLLALPAVLALQGLALRAFASGRGRDLAPGEEAARALLLEEPGGALVAVLPAQLGLLLAALLIAAFASEPLGARLGLVRPSLAPRRSLLSGLGIVLGTGLAYFGAAAAARALFGQGEHVEFVDQLVRTVSRPVGLLLFALLPGACEELFFRGLVQRGLARAWHPAAAIAFGALAFGVVHGDLTQGCFAALLGLWLGWVAWWTRSTLAAMSCHALANALGLALAG